MTGIGQSTSRYEVPIAGEVDSVIVLSWGVDSHTGYRRRHNEDSFVAKSPIFAVADGMGGHAAGDVASKAVVTRLSEAVTAEFTDPEAIDSALKSATADISLAADTSQLGVGTTVTGVALVMDEGEPRWAVFNVGDSRVYLLEKDELVQITVDHSVVQELVDSGMITAGEAEEHPYSNIITRAVGFDAEPAIDFWLIPVRRGMRFLVCSDGLTKEVGNGELQRFLAADLDAERTASALVNAALAAGGRDNVSAVVVDVLQGAAPKGPDSAGKPGADRPDADKTVPRR